jgi:hypothetical protein
MNLGKLLGAGKSFVSGGKLAAYRADKRVYLPRFNSPKNPFTPAIQPELPKPIAQKTIEPVKKPSAPTWAKTEKMPTISAPVKPVPTWTSRLNPVSLWRGSAPETPAQIAARPVQAELSLEKVKVVHNDLSDAEVEVVPMKSRPARATVMVASLQPAKQSWEILGERMLEVKVF